MLLFAFASFEFIISFVVSNVDFNVVIIFLFEFLDFIESVGI